MKRANFFKVSHFHAWKQNQTISTYLDSQDVRIPRLSIQGYKCIQRWRYRSRHDQSSRRSRCQDSLERRKKSQYFYQIVSKARLMNADDISTDACSLLILGAVMYDVIHLLYKSVKMQFTRTPQMRPVLHKKMTDRINNPRKSINETNDFILKLRARG